MLKLKPPTKTEKRKLAYSAPQRENISTKLPKFEKDKSKTIRDKKSKKVLVEKDKSKTMRDKKSKKVFAQEQKNV